MIEIIIVASVVGLIGLVAVLEYIVTKGLVSRVLARLLKFLQTLVGYL